MAKGTTSIMFAQSGNAPARLIKEFRRLHDKPVLKGAYVQESVYIGDIMLDALVSVKTKQELIGDIILLLQSPAKNVISALQSGGTKIHGVLETLSKRENS
jgi:large subunit ribosomal protein L10